MRKSDKIVFYDGECGLCQRSIQFLVKLDVEKTLFFAPLNGETYKNFFQEKSELTTVIFYHQGKIYTKSNAMIEALKSFGGSFKLAVVFKILPLFIRDKLYEFIASQRKKVSCIILVKDGQFLK